MECSIQQRLCQRLCLTLLLVAASAMGQTPRITFSCWISPQTPVFYEIERLYRESFAALGYDFVMQHRPAQRSMVEARTGITDGECMRPASYEGSDPDSPLVRVETVVASADLEAWSYQPDLQVESIMDLKNQRYRIGYLRGTESTRELIETYNLDGFQPVTSTEVGLKMLSAGRLDFYVEPGAAIRLELQQLKLPTPVYPAGKLIHMKGHAYLHQRYYHLADDFAQELSLRLPDGGLVLP